MPRVAGVLVETVRKSVLDQAIFEGAGAVETSACRHDPGKTCWTKQ
ncbi:hypothetical protein [Streptomyces sp. NPDC096030]